VICLALVLKAAVKFETPKAAAFTVMAPSETMDPPVTFSVKIN
jgi:hypothetical protein